MIEFEEFRKFINDDTKIRIFYNDSSWEGDSFTRISMVPDKYDHMGVISISSGKDIKPKGANESYFGIDIFLSGTPLNDQEDYHVL